MNCYRYQMHIHTAPCSACGRMEPAALVQALVAGGYQGCVITNHFYHGNTGVPRNQSWTDFVRPYETDYFALRAAAAPYDLDILFGVEEGVGGGLEILCYGFSPQDLYAHPELREQGAARWHAIAGEIGALCIQAHPFRTRDYIDQRGALPVELIDGIEVFNAANNEADNAEAAAFAAVHPELILTAGADAHLTDRVCVSGIKTTQRLRNNTDLVRVLKNGDYRLTTEY